MLQPEIIGVIGVILLLVLMLLACPVWLTLILVGFTGSGLIIGFKGTLGILATTPYYQVASFGYVVLPMFIIMGSFAMVAGLGDDLYKVARYWIGKLHGGLAMATVAGCALFGCVSGSAIATSATFTKVSLPEMRKNKYDDKLSLAVIASAGPLAVLIPPSGVMVFFCMVTDASLGRLMLAGFIPGALSAVLYMGMIYFWARLKPGLADPTTLTYSWKEKFLALRWIIIVAIIVIIMLGGIYLGVFSPTEAGAIGAFCTFVIALLRKSMSLNKLKDSLLETTRTTVMVLLIVMGSMIFGRFLVVSGITDTIINFFVSLPVPPIVSVVLIMLVYIVGGTVMPALSMLAITLPVVFPLFTVGFGYDPSWVGILSILILEMASITPPLGLTLYAVMASGENVDFGKMVQGIIPFIVVNLVLVVLIAAFPIISLWLPNMMF